MKLRPRCQLGRWLVLVALATAVGCSPTIRRPSWFHPGPAAFQRYNATQFDPYPQNDVGPEIVGGRPRDYAKPPSEVERGRQHRPYGPSSTVQPMQPGPVPLPSAPLY